jgi:hypothetical protein
VFLAAETWLLSASRPFRGAAPLRDFICSRRSSGRSASHR